LHHIQVLILQHLSLLESKNLNCVHHKQHTAITLLL
jgi:hypothetical protein